MTDVLLIVAIKTDQVHIQQRINTVLSVSRPNHDPPETVPCVYARPVSELVASDFDALAHFMSAAGVGRLHIGSVAEETACS